MKFINKFFRKVAAVSLGLNIFANPGSAWEPWGQFENTNVYFGGDSITTNLDGTITIRNASFVVNDQFVYTSWHNINQSTTRFCSIIYNSIFYVDIQSGQIVNCGIATLDQSLQQPVMQMTPQPQPIQPQNFIDDTPPQNSENIDQTPPETITSIEPKHKTTGRYHKDSYCDICKKITMSYKGSERLGGQIRCFPRCDECENEKTITHNWKARCEACKDRGICDENGLTWHFKHANKIKCCNCKNATVTFENLNDLHDKIDGENLAYFCETHGNLTNEQLYYNKVGPFCKQCQYIHNAQRPRKK